MKKKRKYPEQRIKTPKKGKKLNNDSSKRGRINPFMEQELFNLWSSGHTLMEIYEMYLHTPQAFAYNTLTRLKKRNNWDEKIQKMLTEIKLNQENHIKISQRRQFNTIQMVFDMNADRIKRDYMEYFNDPIAYVKKYSEDDGTPPWLVRDVGDLTKLTKGFSDIVRGDRGVDVDEPLGDMDMHTKIKFNSEQKSQIFKILRDAATAVNASTSPMNRKQIDIPITPINLKNKNEN